MEEQEEKLEFDLIVQLLVNNNSVLESKLLSEYLKVFNSHSNFLVKEDLTTPLYRGLGSALRVDPLHHYSPGKASFWTNSPTTAEQFKDNGLKGEGNGTGVILMIENYQGIVGFELSQLIKNNRDKLDRLRKKLQTESSPSQQEIKFLKAMHFVDIELQEPEDRLFILPYKTYHVLAEKKVDGIRVTQIRPDSSLGIFYPDHFFDLTVPQQKPSQ